MSYRYSKYSKEFRSIYKGMRISLDDNHTTEHLNADRKRRLSLANELIHTEAGKHVASFICDCGHKNGAEIHNVYSNGIIKVYNHNTRKMITVLIARPSHIRRYYNACGIDKYIPQGIIDYCRNHQMLGYNEV